MEIENAVLSLDWLEEMQCHQNQETGAILLFAFMLMDSTGWRKLLVRGPNNT